MLKALWPLYNLILVVALLTISLVNAKNGSDIMFAGLLLPIAYHLGDASARRLKKIKKRKSKLQHSTSVATDHLTPTTPLEPIAVDTPENTIAETDRRLFLKLVGSTGLSLFFMAVLGKKSAQAAFFGSVPGPGTVAIKNSAGTPIDPAEAQPTDGYTITEVDDSSTPSYYGFVHKTGAWYITKEDATGGYRYAKGASAFSTSWTGRAGLTYDYFDNVF